MIYMQFRVFKSSLFDQVSRGVSGCLDRSETPGGSGPSGDAPHPPPKGG